MTRLARTVLAVLGIVLLVFLGYLAYGYHTLRVQSAEAARVRTQLESGYETQLASYQQDLPVGMARSSVKAYLNSRKISYNEWGGRISVSLGNEPDVFPCDRWSVYVSLEFDHLQDKTEATPLDKLKSVSLKRLGHCL